VADLRAFAAAGAFGCAAATLITVQSTAGLRRVRALGPGAVVEQASEVLRHQRVRAVKVGALATEANVLAVAKLLARYPRVPVVVDTPMIPTRGRKRLLASRATRALREVLLPKATLVTANAEEAQELSGEPVRTVSEAHDAARALARCGAQAVLVKGGHLGGPSAVDVLAVDGEVVELRAKRLASGSVHGTGCVLASLIAGRLARRPEGRLSRAELVKAIRWAKRVHHATLARAVVVGDGQRVMNP